MKFIKELLWKQLVKSIGLHDIQLGDVTLESGRGKFVAAIAECERIKELNRSLVDSLIDSKNNIDLKSLDEYLYNQIRFYKGENERLRTDIKILKGDNSIKLSDDLIKENQYYTSKYNFLDEKIAHLTSELLKVDGLKIILGASGVYQSGWVPLDEEQMDIVVPENWDKLFRENSVSAFLAEHVWEHLTLEEGKTALQKIYLVLKQGGYVRIAVPDGFHCDTDYVETVKPGGTGDGSEDHKVLFNYIIMKELLKESGFQSIHFLEYFDENKTFHSTEWNTDDGMIHRSVRFDERNKNGQLNYTSLIVDAFK